MPDPVSDEARQILRAWQGVMIEPAPTLNVLLDSLEVAESSIRAKDDLIIALKAMLRTTERQEQMWERLGVPLLKSQVRDYEEALERIDSFTLIVGSVNDAGLLQGIATDALAKYRKKEASDA